MKPTLIYATLALAALTIATPVSAMSVSFSWSGITACSGPSPAFAVSGAPAGTASLRFAMRDQNVPDYNHGDGTVPFSGGKVAQGAISYRGPYPPGGQSHLYIWTIEALDGAGKVLATTSAQGKFPAK